MKEMYRIKKGNLVNKALEIPISFGLVYDNAGIISAEFYVDETLNLEQVASLAYDQESDFFDAFCTTDEGNILEIRKLYFKQIFPSKALAEMICYDSLMYYRTSDVEEDKSGTILDESPLHYLVLEGLEMEYCSPTTHERTTRQKNIGEKRIKWDHTSTGWVADKYLYNLEYYKDYETGNVIVKFDYSSNSVMQYRDYKELKKDYLSVLTFINGAPVKVRKESIGNYFMVGKPIAEVDITYSFTRVINNRHNEYLLTNHYLNRQINILNKVFIENFDSFRQWNQKIDLSSIIYYLAGAIQTRSLEEQFFILIIAFERLTALYAEQSGSRELFVPLRDEFKPIKDELFAVLDKYKMEFGEYMDRAKSVIGGLNQVQRLSTKDKMYGLLSDMKIELSTDLVALIDIVRNKAVQKGDIGEGDQGYQNVVLLNELIHEIILKLIKFLGPRKSTIIYGRAIVSIDTPISQIAVFEKNSKNHVG